MKTSYPTLEEAEEHFSSEFEVDMTKEFVYWNYPLLRKDQDPVYGVPYSDDVVFRPLDIDELCYLLMSKGTYMILFGGVWSSATQSVIGRINYFAHKYGVKDIYLFDFSADGTENASIKRDLTEQPEYDGPGKKAPNDFAIYNYIYGEIVTRFLTNLNDWAANKAYGKNDITYLNLYQDAVSVPDLKEPFLFIYNSENTADHSGCGTAAEHYPIVWAAELHEADETTDAELEGKIFSHVNEEGCIITPYSYSDYIREAFAMNGRGHSFKTQDAFNKDEQINLCKINFQVFRWILQRKGSYVFMIGGPWCAYSQGAAATVNDYAVANNSRVYMSDIRLDSKHPIDFWKYPRKNELTISCPPMKKYDIELWEKYFPNARIQCRIDPDLPYKSNLTVDYTDEDGKLHQVLRVGVPYLLSYNKDHMGPHGHTDPLLATRHDAGELINYSDEYIYNEPLYQWFCASMYRIFYYYKKSLGKEVSDITIDRTSPIVPGERPPHVETVAYTKEHDWYKERADRVSV